MIYDIFVNCNWVATRWQQYSTHLVATQWQQYRTHLVATQWQQYRTHLHKKQYIGQHNETEYTERNIHNNKNT
jgi:hypothetical protein